jgi:hypothetical protein
MDTTLYKVVFDGKTQPDHSPEQVKKNFSHLFRAQTGSGVCVIPWGGISLILFRRLEGVARAVGF